MSQDVQAAHHHCRITSCHKTFTVITGKQKKIHKHTNRGRASLTKERNPVSDKSCQLTEQAGKERRKGQN